MRDEVEHGARLHFHYLRNEVPYECYPLVLIESFHLQCAYTSADSTGVEHLRLVELMAVNQAETGDAMLLVRR